MTDLERAADLVARSIPTGFSTPEDNQRACALIDGLAAEILIMDANPTPEGLTALISRQQRDLELQALELMSLREDAKHHEGELLIARTDVFLSRLESSEGSSP
jgi:hypothetical protein